MSDVKVYVEEAIPEGGTLHLRDEFIEHYLTSVRRLKPGDTLEVAGRQRVAETVLESEDPLTVTIKAVRPVKRFDHQLSVYQAITRKKKFEETVKRGTELGVTRFVPIITERTVRVPNNLEKQVRRWKKIAMDSARISERDALPDVAEPIELDHLDTIEHSPAYLADPNGQPASSTFHGETNEAALFVGPEGGFTDSEKELLASRTENSVRAGSRNLRAETASIALITIWLNETGNFK